MLTTSPWWVYGLISVTLYSLQLVLAQRVLVDFSPIFMTIIRTSPFIILCAMYASLVGGELTKLLHAGWKMQLCVAIIILANIISMVTMFSGIKGSSATHANILSMLSLFMVPVMVFFLFGEARHINIYTILATVLVASGVLLLIVKG